MQITFSEVITDHGQQGLLVESDSTIFPRYSKHQDLNRKLSYFGIGLSVQDGSLQKIKNKI